jgi:hypothetical protein
MTDAYKCERCKEYNEGTGNPLRVGLWNGKSGFGDTYEFKHKAELCDDCKEHVIGLVGDALEQ